MTRRIISRIRPSSKSTSFPSMTIRVIFGIVIVLAILAGIFGPRDAKSHVHEDQGVNILREAGVSFIHPVSSTHVLIFKSGGNYRAGFGTVEEVCEKLKGTGTIITDVRFFQGPKASCK